MIHIRVGIRKKRKKNRELYCRNRDPPEEREVPTSSNPEANPEEDSNPSETEIDTKIKSHCTANYLFRTNQNQSHDVDVKPIMNLQVGDKEIDVFSANSIHETSSHYFKFFSSHLIKSSVVDSRLNPRAIKISSVVL